MTDRQWKDEIRDAFDEGYALSKLGGPIEVAWTLSEARQLTDALNRPERDRCINCNRAFYVKGPNAVRYYFGVRDVGPFCEACDAIVKVHTRFEAKAVPDA